MQPLHHPFHMRRLALAAALALPLLTVPGLAQAGGNDLTLKSSPNLGTAGASGAAKSPQQLRLEARNISMQLGKIQQQTVAGSSDLQSRQQEFSDHLSKVMRQNGHQPDADKQQLQAIMKKMQGGSDMKKSDRTALMQKFRTIRARLQKAQIEALRSDKSLQKQRRKLSKDTFVAMKSAHPETEKLLMRLRQVRQQLQQSQSMPSLSKQP